MLVYCGIRQDATLVSICIAFSAEEEEEKYQLSHYIHRMSRFEEDHMQHKENPIYGNICTDGRGSEDDVCYEHMAGTGSRVQKSDHIADISYASLDLNNFKKKKKTWQYQQSHPQLQQEPPQASVEEDLLGDPEMNVDHLSRDSSLIVSHNDIYLNSQQISQEAEEMGRERERKGLRKWEMDRARERNPEKDQPMDRDMNLGDAPDDLA
ncbi:uncharacterized protein LOC114792807 isoform X2 [Denticeps clupeoides]|uniref:uncharacterized protein LOC114792807 isoform X2 n=1 Tax=Denticeps clupeoides TaxID=299321 RepID=UPI0010A335C3|nr:uncharacterized protein LOC114792807 isoform X2 [Denticeps clupeoides]